MNKVVIDLEFCKIGSQYRNERRICKNEIIQIGAVKLDDNDRIVAEFNEFVHPLYGVIGPEIEALTHITNEMTANAADYETVMDAFLDWIGDEDTTVYAWSRSDENQIRKENSLKGYDNPRLNMLLENCEDLQRLFTNSLGLERPIALQAAISAGEIGFSGQAHSAYSDAYNTAVLYQIMCDKEMFRTFYDVVLDLLTPEPLTFSLGSLFTDTILKQCAVA